MYKINLLNNRFLHHKNTLHYFTHLNLLQSTNLLSCSSNNSISFLVGVILPKNNDKYPSFEKILQSLNIPQISYTDPQPGILDDIEVKNSHSSGSFSSVYSLSSGNIFMTDVIFEILAHFNWTYVALVHSAGEIFTFLIPLIFFQI